LQIGVGVALAFVIGWFLATRADHGSSWRWSLALAAVPSLCQLTFLRWMPESPQWADPAASHHADIEPAPERNGLQTCGSGSNNAPLRTTPLPAVSRLFQRMYLRPILLAISIAMFNQLTGVNIFRVYLLDVLSGATVAHEERYRYAIAVSLLNIGFTSVALFLSDMRGRRPLLIVGSAGMALCLVLLGSPLHGVGPKSYELILSLYNAAFAFSQGPMIWVYLSELFPLAVRGAGQALGSLVHWVTSASVILCFPILQRTLPSGVFWIFASIMCVQALVVALWYPETKGIVLGDLKAHDRAS
jgi:MFS family permease